MVKGSTDRMEVIRLMENELRDPRFQKGHLEAIYQTIVEKIIKEIQNGERVEIRDFGVLYSQDCKGYTGRNPKTNKDVQIPPKRKVRFKVGRRLIQLIDENKETYNIM